MIIDFNLSELDEQFKDVKGTPGYIAPEIFNENEKKDKKVDVYSLGILFFELFYAKKDFFEE